MLSKKKKKIINYGHFFWVRCGDFQAIYSCVSLSLSINNFERNVLFISLKVKPKLKKKKKKNSTASSKINSLSLSLSLSLSRAHSHGRDDLSVSALVLLRTQPQCEATEAFISKPFTPLQGTLFLSLSLSLDRETLSFRVSLLLFVLLITKGCNFLSWLFVNFVFLCIICFWVLIHKLIKEFNSI